MMKRFGVIDIGTLKVKCQVVEAAAAKEVKNICNSNTLTCLGLRLEEHGGKPEERYLQATIEELKRCQKVFQRERADKIRVVSTHALREMGEVGTVIVAKIKKEVGFEVEVISALDEARLFYDAVLSDFLTDRDFATIDVGGGSVQILMGNRKKLKESFLIKTGTATLAGKFAPYEAGDSHPSRGQYEEIKRYVARQLAQVPMRKNVPVVYGSSCIVELFRGIRVPMTKYSYARNHILKAKVGPLEKFLENIWQVPYDERERLYVSPTEKYMWGIDKALINVLTLAKRVGAPYIIPSNANINQGLIYSMVK